MKKSKVIYYYMNNHLQNAIHEIRVGLVKSYIFLKNERKIS
jgi:hypothetical protein